MTLTGQKRALLNSYWRTITRLKGAPPIPDQSLLVHVNGHDNVKLFLQAGRSIFLQMEQALGKYSNSSFQDYDSILDFGCGCGRLERWFDKSVLERWTGVDVSKDVIEFCHKNLKGNYLAINPEPELPFESGQFVLVVSFSVFSHMDPEYAVSWINELHRVTRKGAVLLITTHMEWCAQAYLTEDNLKEYRESGVHVARYVTEGNHHEKYVNAFYSDQYWKEMWENKFELLGIGYGREANEFASADQPRGNELLPMGQALSIFRKR